MQLGASRYKFIPPIPRYNHLPRYTVYRLVFLPRYKVYHTAWFFVPSAHSAVSLTRAVFNIVSDNRILIIRLTEIDKIEPQAGHTADKTESKDKTGT